MSTRLHLRLFRCARTAVASGFLSGLLVFSGAAGVAQASSPAPNLAPLMQEAAGSASPLTVSPEQEAAVNAGLAWLANEQQADGSWSCKIGYKVNESYSYDREMGHVGVTSLACIAFLAGGHLPGRGEYGEVVEKGLEFILASVKGDGYISRYGSRMYSHAFATLFLAEIYGMTHRDDVRLNLQKAVDFIVKSQNAQGGWRYEPYAPESDMSIVVCQVLALRAARIPASITDTQWRLAAQRWLENETKRRSRPQAQQGVNFWADFFPAGTSKEQLRPEDIEAFKVWTIARAKKLPRRFLMHANSVSNFYIQPTAATQAGEALTVNPFGRVSGASASARRGGTPQTVPSGKVTLERAGIYQMLAPSKVVFDKPQSSYDFQLPAAIVQELGRRRVQVELEVESGAIEYAFNEVSPTQMETNLTYNVSLKTARLKDGDRVIYEKRF